MDFSTIPEGLDVIPTPDGEIVRRRWYGARAYFTGVFACFWVSFLVFFYTHALQGPHRPPPAFILFTLPHAAVGLGLIYYTVATFLNKTDVEITGRGVSVTTGPLPWPGSKTVAASEITAVEVRQRSGGRGGIYFTVVYADRERKEKTLMSSFYRPEQAEFIAFKVRTRLGLPAANARPN